MGRNDTFPTEQAARATVSPVFLRKKTRLHRLKVAALCFVSLFAGYVSYSLTIRYRTGSEWRVFREPLVDEEDLKQSWGFDWDSLEPQSHLVYSPCYMNFQCARLSVPLDWFNGTSTKEAAIAVIRLPAKVPVTDPRYGGAIFANPGGPGGSGVGLMVGAGQQLQFLVDSRPNVPVDSNPSSSTDKFFDLISFDPRGVENSRPYTSCQLPAVFAELWEARTLDKGHPDSSDRAASHLWSVFHALGDWCSKSSTYDPDDIKKYMGTAYVARDMLEMVEEHGRWREKEATEQLFGASPSRVQPSIEVPENLLHKTGEEKLQYWGFSYGTLLGSVWAAMYPDRVHRVILDGVVDAEDYIGNQWLADLIDTEKVMQLFYDNCAAAGPDHCPLARHPNSTASDIEYGVTELLESLKESPMVSSYHEPTIITYSHVRSLIFAALYTPIQSFPWLALLLRELQNGDTKRLSEVLNAMYQIHCPECPRNSLGLCEMSGLREPSLRMSADEDVAEGNYAVWAIACSDADPYPYDAYQRTPVSKDALSSDMDAPSNEVKGSRAWYERIWRLMARMSPTIGAVWSGIPLQCSAWNIRSPYRFTGPFTNISTSHPLLWLSTSADPVTPLASAKKMSQGFIDSVVLEQASAGHCSISAYSRCTHNHVRAYFANGTLPAPNTVCPVDQVPFQVNIHGDRSLEHWDWLQSFEGEDRIRADAHTVLARYRSSGFAARSRADYSAFEGSQALRGLMERVKRGAPLML